MAASEQEEFEFRRRAEAEQALKATKSDPKTFGDALVRGIQNLPGDAVNTVKGIAAAVPGLVDLANDPQKMASTASSLIDKGVDIAKGGLQHVREMSSPEYQGSAPAMDKTAYDKFAEDNYNKYGTKENAYKTVSEHPLGPAMTAASIAVPALRALGVGEKMAAGADMLGTAVGKVSAPVGAAIKDVAGAGTRANAAADAMRGATTADYSATRRAAALQAQADAAASTTNATRAQKAAALAERAKARQATLGARQEAAVAASAPPEPAVGPDTTNDVLGYGVRDPALAKQAEIETGMRAADSQYRQALNDVAADRAKSGIGVSDTDTGRALIAKSEAALAADPVTRPDVGRVLADSAGGKLHKELLDTLKPETTPVTAKEAILAKQAGKTVYKGKGNTLFVVNKPDLEVVDNFRRKLGDIIAGNDEGYKGLNVAQARQMYGGLTQALDEYSMGASKTVAENWRKGKEALAPFEKTKAGQTAVAMQDGGPAATPAVNIPGRIIAGGPEVASQYASMAGEGPVKDVIRAHAQNVLRNTKTSAAAARAIAPGTNIAPFIASDPELGSAVTEYLNSLKGAEAQGQLAKDLGSRVATTGGRADALAKASGKYGDMAKALNGTSQEATAAAADYAGRLAKLQVAKPKEVSQIYKGMLEDAYKSGRINVRQYQQGHELAATAERDFALKASRDNWLRLAAGAVGLPPLAKGAWSLATHQ
jgi:hypothetical protein